jgi:hypothetical protein
MNESNMVHSKAMFKKKKKKNLIVQENDDDGQEAKL